MDLIKLGGVFITLASLYYGLKMDITRGRVSMEHGDRLIIGRISALENRDSIRFNNTYRQMRYLWSEAEKKHDRIYRELRLKREENDRVYMGGWQLGPNGWEPAE